jgi:hypothetical protein
MPKSERLSLAHLVRERPDMPRSARIHRGPLAFRLCDPDRMERGIDTWWDHLLDVLGTVGEVSDRDPDGLTVVLSRRDGLTQVVEIVMTPREWNDMTGIGGWSMSAGAKHVRQQVLDQPRDKRFLVYGLYLLTPCDNPELPVSPAFARLAELAEQYPDGVPGGAWVAHRREQT